MTALARLSLRHRTVTLLIVGLVLVSGTAAVRSLNQELFPSFDAPYLVVVASQPGAGPEAVVDGVTRPLEDAVRATTDLRHVDSTSLEGMAFVAAQYEFGVDMADRERQVRERLAIASLPAGVAPTVQRISPDSFPIYSLAASGPDTVAVERYVDGTLRPALDGLEGVATANKTGGSARLVTVLVDPVKLGRAGYSAADVAEAVRTANLSMPVGGLAAEVSQLPVQVETTTATLDEIRTLPLGPPRADATVPPTIGDVAVVTPSEQGAGSTISRTDGKPSIGLEVIKDQSANTVRTVHRIEAALTAHPPPADVAVTEVLNQAPQVEESVDGLTRDAVLGAVFAVLLILVFLRSVRSTFVAGVSIPLSLLVAFLLMQARDISLNVLTLGALSVAAGRVIDDAIVVLENIYRLLETGMERTEAVLVGTTQMVPAITASTVTTVAVFLPLAFVGGLVGEVFVGFALTVTFALAASLLVAVTAVPVLAELFLRSRRTRGGSNALRPPGRLRDAYRVRLAWALGHRQRVMALAFGLLALSGVAASRVPTSLFPGGKTRALLVNLTAPPGTSLGATSDRIGALEEHLRSLPGVERSSTVVGTSDSATAAFSGAGSGSNSATVTVDLATGADAGQLTERIEAFIPRMGLTGAVSEVTSDFGNSDLTVAVTGDDFASVAVGAGRVSGVLQRLAGLEHVSSNVAAERLRLTVDIDPARTVARGLNPRTVASAVQQALSPTPAARAVIEGVERQVVVQIDPAAAGYAGDLRSLPVAAGVSLGDVGEVNVARTPTAVSHHDGQRSAEVRAVVTSSNTGQVNGEVEKALSLLALPPGVETSLGGLAEMQKDSFRALGVAMAVAVFLVYLTMVVAFGSLLTPLVILFSLPLAAVGAFPALLLTGRELGMPAMIGLLTLIGIVVTNAIVLLEFVERQRREGIETREALLVGGQTRLRPIVMTATATVCALFPLALGLSEGALLSASLATVVIGGLVSSTVLTLIVIPVAYSLADELRARVTRRSRARAPEREEARPEKPSLVEEPAGDQFVTGVPAPEAFATNGSPAEVAVERSSEDGPADAPHEIWAPPRPAPAEPGFDAAVDEVWLLPETPEPRDVNVREPTREAR